MLQIHKRQNTVNINPKEFDIYNEKLKELQEKQGIEISSMKECFDFLLDTVLNTDVTTKSESVEKEIVEIMPDNAVILDDNVQYSKEVINRLIDYTDSLDRTYENVNLSLADRIGDCINIAQESPEIKIEEKEVPVQLGDFELILKLTDQEGRPKETKKRILQEINRSRDLRFGTDETISETINALIFQNSTIFNYEGEVYTGLTKRKLRQG